MAWHKRLLGEDRVSREWYWSNPDTGEVALETEWRPIEGIAADCKGLYNLFDENSRWKGDLHHVASIPLCIVEKIWREEGVNILTDKDRLRKWLNDPDNRAFRTRPGRV